MSQSFMYSSFQEPLRHAVLNWLKERQQMLVLMCGIQSDSPLSNRTLPTGTRIQDFCQVLMDYMSAAHFEIFNGLLNELKPDSAMAIRDKVHHLFGLLQPSTDCALRFNDLFVSDESCEDLAPSLNTELSELGLALEERFRIEDEILDMVHGFLCKACTAETA